MRLPIIMRWVEARNEWHMETLQGHTLQEFINCENMPKMFEGIDKSKLNEYTLTIEKGHPWKATSQG